MTRIRIGDSESVNLLARRYSESDKAQIIAAANSEVVDLGTALSTCSHYLISGKRPSYYRDAVVNLLKRNVRYVCLALNPDSEIARIYSDQRNEPDLVAKTTQSLDGLKTFARSADSSFFEVWLYSALPHFASIFIDRKHDGLLIYAPYLPNLGIKKIERADTPHILLRASSIRSFSAQIDSYIDHLFSDASTKRFI